MRRATCSSPTGGRARSGAWPRAPAPIPVTAASAIPTHGPTAPATSGSPTSVAPPHAHQHRGHARHHDHLGPDRRDASALTNSPAWPSTIGGKVWFSEWGDGSGRNCSIASIRPETNGCAAIRCPAATTATTSCIGNPYLWLGDSTQGRIVRVQHERPLTVTYWDIGAIPNPAAWPSTPPATSGGPTWAPESGPAGTNRPPRLDDVHAARLPRPPDNRDPLYGRGARRQDLVYGPGRRGRHHRDLLRPAALVSGSTSTRSPANSTRPGLQAAWVRGRRVQSPPRAGTWTDPGHHVTGRTLPLPAPPAGPSTSAREPKLPYGISADATLSWVTDRL